MTADNANPFASPRAVDEPAAPPLATSEWSADDIRRLRNVGGGLRMIYFATCGALGVIIFLTLLGLEVFGEIDWFVAFIGLSVAAGFALYVIGMIGLGLCLYAPQASRARPLAIAALALQLTALMINLIVGAGLLGVPIGVAESQVVTNLMALASAVCLLIYLWRVADFIARDDVARRCRRTLIVSGVCLPVLLIASAAAGALAVGGSRLLAAIGVVALVGGIGSLVAFLMFANTITYLRKAIGEAINAP